jgi:hypothetical protein
LAWLEYEEEKYYNKGIGFRYHPPVSYPGKRQELAGWMTGNRKWTRGVRKKNKTDVVTNSWCKLWTSCGTCITLPVEMPPRRIPTSPNDATAPGKCAETSKIVNVRAKAHAKFEETDQEIGDVAVVLRKNKTSERKIIYKKTLLSGFYSPRRVCT